MLGYLRDLGVEDLLLLQDHLVLLGALPEELLEARLLRLPGLLDLLQALRALGLREYCIVLYYSILYYITLYYITIIYICIERERERGIYLFTWPSPPAPPPSPSPRRGASRARPSALTPGLHNKIPAHKIFARVWVAQ